jgi:hypothetical protein
MTSAKILPDLLAAAVALIDVTVLALLVLLLGGAA